MTEVVAVAAPVAPVGASVKYGLDTYEKLKEVVVSNKMVGARVGPLFELTESTTKRVLEVSPIKLESVIDAVDTRVDAAVTYGTETAQKVYEALGKLKNKTTAAIHTRLNSVKVDQEAETPEEVNFSTVADDLSVIASERLSMALDASEGFMAQYLPISDEDKEELKVEVAKGELKPLAFRAGRQSKVAAKRLQEQIINKMTGLKTRTTEVVHVDLVKYSEFLDKQKTAVTNTIYIALEKVDEKAVQPVKDIAAKGANAVNTRVIVPARERVSAVRIPFQGRMVAIWTVIGEGYEAKIVKPRAQIVQMFKEELALQQELAREKSGSGEDLSIAAGLKAVVTAARARVTKEFDGRIVPFVNKVLGRAAPEDTYDEDEDEDSE